MKEHPTCPAKPLKESLAEPTSLQPSASCCCRFTLHPQPLALDYDEFEKLLLGLAHLLAWARKKGDAFEEFLGELLDNVYKRAGVLLELPPEEGEASSKGKEQLRHV
jgi:hypothetical protein